MNKRTKKLLAMMAATPRLRRVSGLPPLSYTAKKAGFLTDYRIYGQTVDGESVGDRTGKLVPDISVENGWQVGYLNGDTGKYNPTHTFGEILSPFISLDKITSFTISATNYNNPSMSVYYFNQNSYILNKNEYNYDGSVFNNIPINATQFRFAIRTGYQSIEEVQDAGFHIMVNAGSTPLPYEPYGYKVPVTVSNGADTLTTPIYLPEQIRKVGDEVEYIDYGKQKQHRVRKNQVVSNVTSRTIDNGDGTFFYITANHDGSVTCNGYAKSTIFISNSYIAELEASTRYILSGCPQGGKYMSYRLDLRFPTGQAIDPIVDYGIGYTFSVDTPGIYVPTVRIAADYTCDNLTFYPMIRKADIEDDTYEPYIENTDLDVTLPAMPTLAGTNTLSVGTEVQPSSIEVTGNIKPIETETGGGDSNDV